MKKRRLKLEGPKDISMGKFALIISVIIVACVVVIAITLKKG